MAGCFHGLKESKVKFAGPELTNMGNEGKHHHLGGRLGSSYLKIKKTNMTTHHIAEIKPQQKGRL